MHAVRDENCERQLMTKKEIDSFEETPNKSLDLSQFKYLGEPDAIVSAVICGEYLLVEHLISIGVDINITDGYGRTALMVAVDDRNAGLVSMLLDNGADPNIRDIDGDYPLDVAKYRNDNELIELLTKRGAFGNDGPSKKKQRDDEIYAAFDIANSIKLKKL
jgi:ankyrin repeat protein